MTSDDIDITQTQILKALEKGIELIKRHMEIEEYRKKYQAFEDYSVLLNIRNLQVLGVTTKLSMTFGFKIEGNEPKIVSSIKSPDITGTCTYDTLKSIARGYIKIKRGPYKGDKLVFSPKKAVQKELLTFEGPKTVWLTKIDFLDEIFGDMQRYGIVETISKMLP